MADVHEHREFNRTLSKESKACRTKRKRLSSSDYVLKKRQPFGLGRKGKGDVFVTNKTDFKAQLKKCEKLLEDGASEIIIHGLGAAINRACNLALQLKEIHHGGVELDVKTATTSLIDDFEPLNDDADYETNSRNNSSELVHWLGLTMFEIWLHLVSLYIFTVLLALKIDENFFIGHAGWWAVFSPLFVADGLNTYFCAIILIRMHMEGMIKVGILRALWSKISLLLIFVFKYLLCKKLTGQSTLEYSEVLSPIFILLQLIAVRACQLH